MLLLKLNERGCNIQLLILFSNFSSVKCPKPWNIVFKKALQGDVNFGLDDLTLQLAAWPAPCDVTGKEKWMLLALNDCGHVFCSVISSRSFPGNSFTKHFHAYYFNS